MTGKLYLCGTPIGNLEDMTFRVIRVLKEVDIIAAEDTRQTMKLLNHFDIKKPMISYHEHNKYEKGTELLQKLANGQNIALVTDAGMPGISDPGEDLVKLCIENGIDVEAVPGVTASITALVLSGFSTSRFIFQGFIAREGRVRREVLESLKEETGTVIIYEAPHRVKETLKDLYSYLGDRRIAVCRELTKKFEEVIRVKLDEAIHIYDEKEPRGEYVLVLEGRNLEELQLEAQRRWEDMTVDDHIEIYLREGLSKKEAIKKVAKDRGLSKREIYKHTIEE